MISDAACIRVRGFSVTAEESNGTIGKNVENDNGLGCHAITCLETETETDGMIYPNWEIPSSLLTRMQMDWLVVPSFVRGMTLIPYGGAGDFDRWSSILMTWSSVFF